MTYLRDTQYDRAKLMDLAGHLGEVAGWDMIVNLPEDEQLLDIRMADFVPKSSGEPMGNPERGVVCVTSTRLLFFRREPEVSEDRDLSVATGYLTECRLCHRPMDRTRAARYFPKKESSIFALRKKMASLYFPDLMPLLEIPLAGIVAMMPFMDKSKQATIDLEIDLRSEGELIFKLLPINPQIRLVLGQRFLEHPYPEIASTMPLVSACPIDELVALTDRLREIQAEIDYDKLPKKLFLSPWSLSQLFFTPKAKVKLIHNGEQAQGRIYLENGNLILSRKLSKATLFNVGSLEDLGWNDEENELLLKGPGVHYKIEGEAHSTQFAQIRFYLEELLTGRREIWEDPKKYSNLSPEAKPDPVGELLRYHLAPCNDPAIRLSESIEEKLLDEFMDGFGQLLPPEETAQCLILLDKSAQEGILFTDEGFYVRKKAKSGQRLAYSKLLEKVEFKKSFISNTIAVGTLVFKIDSLGKETRSALDLVIKEISRRAML